MPVLRLALANLKKRRGAAVSFALILMLAVLLLDAGLTLLLHLPGYFDESNERLHGPHYTVRVPNNLYLDEYAQFFEQDPRVSELEVEEVVLMDNATYPVAGGDFLVLPSIFNAGEARSLLPLSVTEAAAVEPGEGVYVPLSLRQQGYAPGDEFPITYQENTYTYRIAGFFESTWFATMTSNLLNFYLEPAAWERLYREVGGGKLLSVRLHDPAQLEALITDFQAATGIRLEAPGFDMQIAGVGLDTMRSAGTMITGILSAMFAGFSVIVLAIALLVIRFRVADTIEDSIQSIGALEAIGYTSGQVRLALMLECAAAGLAGSLVGVGCCYGVLELLGGLISASLGVGWRRALHPAFDFASVCAVLLAACLTALVATRRIRRLPPVTALRFGLSTHSFRRNVLPLSTSRCPLSLSLGCKAAGANPWQYAMLALILCGVTCAASFATLMYATFAVDPSRFAVLVGEELSDVLLQLTPHADSTAVRERMEQREGVRGTAVLDAASVSLDGELITAQVSDDFSRLQTVRVYEGAFPVYDNEVAITGLLGNRLGKSIGDHVTLEYAGVTAQYLITGFCQSMSNFGRKCLLTDEGLLRLKADYEIGTVNVYLAPGVDAVDWMARLSREPFVLGSETDFAHEKLQSLLSLYGVDSAQFALMDGDTIVRSGDTAGYQIERVVAEGALMASSVGTYVGFIAALSVGILILGAAITAVILHLVVRSTILRRRKEFGVYRAIGYTCAQLRMQIALSFLPFSLPGVAVGAVAGGLLTGPALSALMANLGITRLDIPPQPLLLAALTAAVLLLTWGCALLASSPVKRISAYQLFTE